MIETRSLEIVVTFVQTIAGNYVWGNRFIHKS